MQSQSPAVSNVSHGLLSVTERAIGAPSLIQPGSIGSGRRSVRDVSNVVPHESITVLPELAAPDSIERPPNGLRLGVAATSQAALKVYRPGHSWHKSGHFGPRLRRSPKVRKS